MTECPNHPGRRSLILALKPRKPTPCRLWLATAAASAHAGPAVHISRPRSPQFPRFREPPQLPAQRMPAGSTSRTARLHPKEGGAIGHCRTGSSSCRASHKFAGPPSKQRRNRDRTSGLRGPAWAKNQHDCQRLRSRTWHFSQQLKQSAHRRHRGGVPESTSTTTGGSSSRRTAHTQTPGSRS